MSTALSTLRNVLMSKQLLEVSTPGRIATGYPQGVTHGDFEIDSILQGIIPDLSHGILTGPGTPGSKGQNFMFLSEILSSLGWRGDGNSRPLVAWMVMGSVSNLWNHSP